MPVLPIVDQEHVLHPTRREGHDKANNSEAVFGGGDPRRELITDGQRSQENG
jgi:hypothetical protein